MSPITSRILQLRLGKLARTNRIAFMGTGISTCSSATNKYNSTASCVHFTGCLAPTSFFLVHPIMSTMNPTPIHIPVDDILIETFISLAERSRRSFRSILAASHVWHFACPELWRRFAFLTRYNGRYRTDKDEAFEQEMMRRSGGLTLDGGWQHHSRRNVYTIGKELRYRDRFRSYHLPLLLGDADWWTTASSHHGHPRIIWSVQAKTPLTALEELSYFSLGGSGSIHSAPAHRRGQEYLFGEDLSVPELRVLRVKDVSMAMQRLRLPKLEELELEGNLALVPLQIIDGSPVPRCIFETLLSHSGIKRLRLHLHSTAKEGVKGRLVLPQLSEIDLAMDFDSLLVFLRHTSMPKCRTVDIQLIRDSNFGHPETCDEDIVDVACTTVTTFDYLVLPLSESSSNTLSFLRCDEAEVEYVFSPQFHDAPHKAREPYLKDIAVRISLLPSGPPRRGTIVFGIMAGWMFSSRGLEAERYKAEINHFIRHPSMSVKRLICSLECAEVVLEGGLTPIGEGRYISTDPPLEVITV
ncbi:hypothetical protein FA13DRAFT_1730606 [Coprinellus micaceus]|uniref:Uncharacterized protein n=1 Tax=Coprinellus micaceus TaxID=71717 RepID=A0A4Y7TJ87_COPMI|nr:hypothetical protein FA13DRAFT_1730606 [Coprinellus micaceus]